MASRIATHDPYAQTQQCHDVEPDLARRGESVEECDLGEGDLALVFIR